MTIAFIAIDYPPVLGGISRYTGDIVRFMSRAWPVNVYLCSAKQPKAWAQHPHVNVIDPAELHRHPDIIAQQLKSDGIRHVFFNHIDMAEPRTVRAFRKAGMDCSCFFYGADINLRRSLKNYARLYTGSFLLRHRIVISEGTRSVFRRRLPGLSTVMVQPGIEGTGNVNAPDRAGDGIIAVGRLIRRKGFDVLVDALAIMNVKNIQTRLTIVGDGPDAEWLKNRVRELSLNKQVRFLAGLSDEEIRHELRKHRVFCLLPRSLGNGDIEGFGIVFLEAAREGLPVVAGRSGGVPDAVWDGINGFLVNPASADEAANRLTELLSDNDLWQKQSRKSLEWCKKFDWTNRNPKREFAFLDGSV